MAGDHKCPVCQSTFTRPQHVARHMRSHTGDRPYKCQHCGDQFARSDLLSRHINKCHASEKPPTTTAPSRRKGTAAASRATTSKQACDQCVTSSLPCDGANPCSKCVQRKCRCTYVKFHRQTAPAGPGHPLPTLPPAGIGRHSISLGAPRLPDDFLLAPPPGTMNMSSMYAPQYALHHAAAVYPHDYTSLPPLATALGPSESAMLQSHHREAMENPDAMARIRAQAELMSRAGVMSNGTLTLAQPAPTADTSAALPGLYAAAAAAGAQDGQYERFHMPAQQWDAHRQYQHTKGFEAPYGPRSQSHPTVSTFSAAGAAGGEPQTHPPTGTASSSFDAGAGAAAASYQHAGLPPSTSLYAHQQPSHHQTRSEDLSGSEGDFGSDVGSTGTGPSHSIPSSANSSGVHLPLPGFNNLRTRDELNGKEFDQRYPGDGQTSQTNHEGEGGFSASFGLMSLDDPAVMAGLANDGQPFFSGLTPFASGSNGPGGPGGFLGTPTQDLIAQLKSAGGREGENKEMRDFWKMYLKTPLTSSGSGLLFPLQTPTGPGAQLGHGSNVGRPSPSRRHSRVNSLPSMKTPPLYADERFGNSYVRPSTGDQYDSHANPSQNQGQPAAGGYNSNVRTTLHAAEDLKSYEQAVLARKAPMNLSLIHKRKGSLATASGSGSGSNPGPGPKSKSMSPVVPHATFSTNVSTSLPSGGASRISELLNRPGSSSSAGTNESGGSGMSPPPDAGAANTTASSSLALAFGGEQGAPAPADSGTTAASSSYLSAPSYRPSFKRIASQTLGPEHAKRALLGPAGWDQEGDEDEEGGPEPVAEEEEEEEEQAGSAGAFGGEGVRQVSLAATTQS